MKRRSSSYSGRHTTISQAITPPGTKTQGNVVQHSQPLHSQFPLTSRASSSSHEQLPLQCSMRRACFFAQVPAHMLGEPFAHWIIPEVRFRHWSAGFWKCSVDFSEWKMHLVLLFRRHLTNGIRLQGNLFSLWPPLWQKGLKKGNFGDFEELSRGFKPLIPAWSPLWSPWSPFSPFEAPYKAPLKPPWSPLKLPFESPFKLPLRGLLKAFFVHPLNPFGAP